MTCRGTDTALSVVSRITCLLALRVGSDDWIIAGSITRRGVVEKDHRRRRQEEDRGISQVAMACFDVQCREERELVRPASVQEAVMKHGLDRIRGAVRKHGVENSARPSLKQA